MAALMPQACERCWRRKQKCSREVPVCAECRTASVNCVQRRFGSTVDGHDGGHETGIEALKGRIRNMRMHLQNGSQQGSPANTSNSSPQTGYPAGAQAPASNDVPLVNGPAGGHGQHDGHETMQDDVAYLSLSAMAERTDRQPFLTGGLSFLTLLYAATGVSGSNPTLPVGHNASLSGPLAEFRQSGLSNVELRGPEMRAAFEIFTNKVRIEYPFMTSTELREHYEGATQSQTANNNEQVPPEKLALAYLGTATGILLSTHYTYKEMYATELAVRAVRLMPYVLDHAGQISVVRCLTALTIYSLYTPYGGSTWHLLGLTMTRCISAGMHTARVSDPNSDSEEKRQSSRVLWTLYILDTCLSATMDRPFYLNDRDIQSLIPASPPSRVSEADSEDAMFRHLIQYTQTLRSIRRTQDADTGIICHFINIRHWRETNPLGDSSNPFHVKLCAYGYIELLKHPSFLQDSDRPSVISQALDEFSTYLILLEEQLSSHSGAVSSLDALQLFAIGVLFATQASSLRSDSQASSTIVTQNGADSAAGLFQALNILTLLSARYSAVRCLRDILSELQKVSTQGRPRDQLKSLVECSDVVVSRPIQTLIFGESSDLRTL